MRIKELRLTNYRKFKTKSFSFTPGVNFIVGSNASGKTTLIEAIGFAIYGDLLMGADLRDVLHFGSNLCRIELTILNSNEIKAIREIRKRNANVTQRVTLVNEVVRTSDLNMIRKIFIDKELFFEIVSVSQSSFHNLLDMSQRRFRDIFSSHISPWDLNHILDNSKSLQSHLKSRASLYEEKIAGGEKVRLQHKSATKNLDSVLDLRKDLTKKLEGIEKKRDKLMEELGRKDNELREIQSLNKILQKISKHQRNSFEDLKKCIESSKQTELPSSPIPMISEGFRNYLSKIDSLYDKSLELSNIVNNLLEFGKEREYDITRKDRELSSDLVQNAVEKGKIESQLVDVSALVRVRELEKESVEGAVKLLDENESEMKRYKTLLMIEGKLTDLVRTFWGKHFEQFLSRVTDRMNQYMKNMDIDIRMDIEDERMRVAIYGNICDFNILSGGERTLLNLLSRIALIKEMGHNDLLILDDAITFLDERTALKVFSFLASLREDFEQIIITTHRKDIPMDFDNRIVLDD